MSQAATEGGRVPGIAVRARSSEISARIASVFVEDNIELTRATLITPGLRLDHHSKAGGNVSPMDCLSGRVRNDSESGRVREYAGRRERPRIRNRVC